MEVMEKVISLMEKLTGLGRHLIDLASCSFVVSTSHAINERGDVLCQRVLALLE